MVSAEPEGMQMLQSMEIVGVGGAAVPQDVGDSLVNNGVNLVSRFGSAECGFLLSSHREYEKDKEWQYLRSHTLGLLTFEKQQDGSGLSELIIRPGWPYMAKRNREDGSLATADLFAPHPTIKNAWKYHSRADSQLTLITGKKFDPAPLEAAIASHELLSDAMIFGNGMQSAGALLFRSEKSITMNKDRVLDEIWPAINRMNKEGQAHTRLSKAMLVVMDPGAPVPEKSSKGTILRAQAEKTFEKDIQRAYDQSIANSDDKSIITIPDDEIPTAVLEIIKTVLGTTDRIPADTDLFSFGVDSVACMAIRAKLQSRVLDPKAQALPLNVVYDCGNIDRLSKYLVNVRKGRITDSEDEIQLMKDLVAQYSNFSAPLPTVQQSNGNMDISKKFPNDTPERQGENIVSHPAFHCVVISPESESESHQPRHTIPNRELITPQLLTGATGALGAHILHLLRSTPSISTITCLVRASSPHAAHERVSKSLMARGKPGLPPFSASLSPANPPLSNANTPTTASEKPTVTCLPCTLSHPSLGLSPEKYADLAKNTTIIIHAAWAVNFTARLRSFEKDHIAGLSHLLHLSTSSPRTTAPPIRFLFLSSTASVTNTPASAHPIAEHVSSNPENASGLGYSRSKWVAEGICDAFYHRRNQLSPNGHGSGSKEKGSNIAILRIGQITSDTNSGIWNTSEAYPLMLSTAPILHALPDLDYLRLDWLPVDMAAKAVLEVAQCMRENKINVENGNGKHDKKLDDGGKGDQESGERAREVENNADEEGCPVLHILNPSTSPTWTDLLHLITTTSPSLDLELLTPREWLARLEAYEGDLPAKKLVGLWREALGAGDDGKSSGDKKGGEVDGAGEDGTRAGKKDEKKTALTFDMNSAKSMSATMRDIQPLDQEFLVKMWRWVEGVAKGDAA
ncbi:MAG: hypothetical protein Q9169_005468 [Polycauliona sp. 2 TL-2023]